MNPNNTFSVAAASLTMLLIAITATAQSPATGQILGHGYVDLGLSVMWATCNIGADKPEDYGVYLSWGRATTTNIKNGRYPETENFVDAASVNWGLAWRMPTETEMQELIDNCKWSWTKINKVQGYIIKSKINDNSIFLPATAPGLSRWSCYYSSTPNKDGAYGFEFWQKEYHLSYVGKYMHSIRPVTTLLATTTTENTQSPTTGQILGHEYVDLGLSVKWATCNIGAYSPSDYGDYFAWGEAETKLSYDQNNSSTFGKKSCDFFDAAAKWGSVWRVPTRDEMRELIDNCKWQRETLDNHNGYKVTSKLNGNHIFIPLAGIYEGKLLKDVGLRGEYWLFDPGDDNEVLCPEYSSCLRFFNGYTIGGENRYVGLPVRPVTK